MVLREVDHDTPWICLSRFQIPYLFLISFSIFGLILFSSGWKEIELGFGPNIEVLVVSLLGGTVLWLLFNLIAISELGELSTLVGVILLYAFALYLIRFLHLTPAGDFNTVFPLAYIAFSVTQGLFLGTTLIVSQNTVAPPQQHSSMPHHEWQKYLELHLENWWRLGELFLTLGLIIGASLLLKVIPHPLGHKGKWVIALLGGPFAVQIMLIFGFVRAKMNHMEENLNSRYR